MCRRCRDGVKVSLGAVEVLYHSCLGGWPVLQRDTLCTGPDLKFDEFINAKYDELIKHRAYNSSSNHKQPEQFWWCDQVVQPRRFTAGKTALIPVKLVKPMYKKSKSVLTVALTYYVQHLSDCICILNTSAE